MRARGRRGKELRQGQRTLGGADAHERRQLRERGGGRVVGEEGEHRGARHSGKNRSI